MFGFNRDEINMIILAAKRMHVEEIKVAAWAYEAACLNYWEPSEWSVDQLVEGYTADKIAVY